MEDGERWIDAAVWIDFRGKGQPGGGLFLDVLALSKGVFCISINQSEHLFVGFSGGVRGVRFESEYHLHNNANFASLFLSFFQ